MPLDITNIKHRDLFDKLRVFQLAGEESQSGWDYAIPQSCFDELLKMGVEDAGRWFVMDCQSQPWRLRHIGEAVFTILHARSEANKEIMMALHGDEIVSSIFRDFAGNTVFNEADSGLVDLNMAIGIATEAYSRGLRAGRPNPPYQFGKQHRIHIKYLEDGVPREMVSHEGVEIQSVVDLDAPPLVNESDLIMESAIEPGDSATAPCSITLRKWGTDQWVTHTHNHQDGGYHGGAYFFNEIDALRNYAGRCAELGVKPF